MSSYIRKPVLPAIYVSFCLVLLVCSVRTVPLLAIVTGHKLAPEIIPGKSVGPIQLGDDDKKVVQVLSEFPTIVQRVSYPICGTIGMIEWFDKDLDNAGLFLFLRGDKVYQIESETARFRTSGGITEHSLPEDVKRQYPNMEAYELLSSASNLTGGRNLIYWVDRNRGVAFSFYFNTKRQRRLVYRVIIFESETDFQPNGCVTRPQKLKKLSPYSLEPPANSA